MRLIDSKLNPRIVRRLKRAGVFTLETLSTTTVRHLRSLVGIGEKTIKDIASFVNIEVNLKDKYLRFMVFESTFNNAPFGFFDSSYYNLELAKERCSHLEPGYSQVFDRLEGKIVYANAIIDDN